MSTHILWWVTRQDKRSQLVAIRRAVSQFNAALHQLEGDCPSNPEQLTNEDDIKAMIKMFTNNYKAVPDVQLKLAQLQESMGLAISLQQLFIEAAEKLHKEGKQASQDFNKTEFNL